MYLYLMLGIIQLATSLKFTHLPSFVTATSENIILKCKTDNKLARIKWKVNNTDILKSVLTFWEAATGQLQCIASYGKELIYSPILELVKPEPVQDTQLLIQTVYKGVSFEYSKLLVSHKDQVECTGNAQIMDNKYAYIRGSPSHIRCYLKSLNITTASYEVFPVLISDSMIFYPPEGSVIHLSSTKHGICASSNCDQFIYKQEGERVELEDIKSGKCTCRSCYGEVRNFTVKFPEPVRIRNEFKKTITIHKIQEIVQLECEYSGSPAEVRWFFDDVRNEISNCRNKLQIVLKSHEIFESGRDRRLVSCFVINEDSVDHKETILMKS